MGILLGGWSPLSPPWCAKFGAATYFSMRHFYAIPARNTIPAFILASPAFKLMHALHAFACTRYRRVCMVHGDEACHDTLFRSCLLCLTQVNGAATCYCSGMLTKTTSFMQPSTKTTRARAWRRMPKQHWVGAVLLLHARVCGASRRRCTCYCAHSLPWQARSASASTWQSPMAALTTCPLSWVRAAGIGTCA